MQDRLGKLAPEHIQAVLKEASYANDHSDV